MSERTPSPDVMPIDGTYNFRDLGGLPLTSGGATRHGVFFRSDALSGLTAQGEQQLAATPVGVIVDFRTDQERQTAPDRIPSTRPFRTVDLSILAGSMSDMAKTFIGHGGKPSPETMKQAMEQIPSLGAMYVGILEGGASPFVDVARSIAASREDQPTAVLVHCTAGKDRTGVGTALMLEAAGVTREAIIANYAESQHNLAGPWADGMLRMIESMGIPLTPALQELICGTPPKAIAQALDWVDEHGGITAYLASGGLTDDELTALRNSLAA